MFIQMVLAKVQRALEDRVRAKADNLEEGKVASETLKNYEELLLHKNNKGLSVFDECKQSKNYSF